MSYLQKQGCRISLLVMLALVLSACATVRDALHLQQRVPVPERVQGLSYLAISQIGALQDSCLTLSNHYENQTQLPREEVAALVFDCESVIARAQQEISNRVKQAEAEAISESLKEDYEQFLARREAEWRRAEQQRQAAAALRAQLEEAERQQREREAALKEQIKSTQAYAALEKIKDKPIAHNAGDPSDTMLKTFLACVELAYPNKGYAVKQNGKELNIEVKEAKLPRGDLPIIMRFTESSDYWRMTYLMVADIEARSDADRFVLSQNLTAESCPQEGGLF